VTILTKHRRRLFERDDAAVLCREHLLRAARERRFAVRAASVMPDHLHVLVEGVRSDSDFGAFMKLFKQLTGFHIKQLTGYPVWVNGYFERVVRHDEDTRRYVQYILRNPVRARLAPDVGVHLHTWADPDWATSKPDLQVGRLTDEQDRSNGPREHELLNPGRSSPD